MDAQRVSRLNEIGMVRRLSLLGNSLAAVCVLATVVGGCSSPSATARRDGITSGSSSAERRRFAFRGVRGQAIFVDPASRIVMVHTAVRNQARDPGVRETNALWRSIVRELGG